jgi:LacI family transcriptional regulator
MAAMVFDSDKRPTLRSLAEITGLGVSTVSQALRGSPEIAEETRRRVQLAAQQAGYRPNRAGVRLRTGRTNVIAVVLNPQEEGTGFFADFVYGISDGIAGTQYHLVVAPYSLSDPLEPVRYIVETQSADGIIFSRTQPDDLRVRYLAQNRIPFVSHGRTQMDIQHPFYDYDNERYAFEAVAALKARHRQRIALLGPPPGLTYHYHTNRGFERAIEQFRLDSLHLGSINIETPLEEIKSFAGHLAAQDHRPDGIVCSSASSAVAVATAFASAGLVIGRDFDMTSKSAPQLIRLAVPGLIFFDEDFRRAGHSLAQLVMKAIGGGETSSLQDLAFG